MEIANFIVQNSAGRAVLAFQEDDRSIDKVLDAAHFIKVDGIRIGRDIEMYGFFGDGIMGWMETHPIFLGEILLAIKEHGLADSYTIAGESLRQLGHKVYSGEVLEKWNNLF